MTQFAIEMLDVSENLKAKIQPVHIFERPKRGSAQASTYGFTAGEVARTGEFWVPTSDLLRDAIKWSCTKSGIHVRVPITAYRTQLMAKSFILATGLEMGVRASRDLERHTSRPLLGVTLFIGKSVDITDDKQAYRCYIGLAFQVESNSDRKGAGQ